VSHRFDSAFGHRTVVQDRLCANSYNLVLSLLAHNIEICAKSDISFLSELAHNEVGAGKMADLARTPNQIGNLIRRARKKRGLSQSQLGELAGLRQETISLIETGNPAAKLETILSVLSALDLEFRIVPRSKGSAAELEDIF
jgi:HTH-type transcriptional regulator/antitoxin HipB